MEEPRLSGWSYRLAPDLVLHSPKGSAAAEAPAGRVLRLRSGGAFPPGHPTTRLCLDLLRAALAVGPGRDLLDVGCGAGVLALAAAALGVPRVVGVDISLAAALATRENARENGLGGTIMAINGSTECLNGRFDLVAANLPWEVQMTKAAELDRLTAAHGRLILSGFRDNQEQALRAQYRQLGWYLRRRSVKEFHHPELPPDLSFTWVAWWLARS